MSSNTEFIETIFHKNNTDVNKVVLGLLAIPVCALLGTLIEGISDLTIRKAIKIISKHTLPSFLLGQRRLAVEVAKVSSIFSRLADKNETFIQFVGISNEGAGELASGIFHSKSPKEQFDWALSHYSMFYLASSFVVLIILYSMLPLLSHDLISALNISLFWTFFAAMISLYICMSVALDKFLYTYLMTYRFAIIWLEEKENK